MNVSLEGMLQEELWKLFPIMLTEHRGCWHDWYQAEKEDLLLILSGTVKIHHIGSTAVNGIWAKPVIDILLEADLSDYDEIKKTLLNNNYICMAQTETRIDFNKGYTLAGLGEKVYHLHLREFGDNDELYFRDYLNEYKGKAKEYEKLKLSLGKQFKFNRFRYTEGKTEFVNGCTQKAIAKYGKIY